MTELTQATSDAKTDESKALDERERVRVQSVNRKFNAVATTLGAGAATGLLAAAFFPGALVLAGAATVGLVAGAAANFRTKI